VEALVAAEGVRARDVQPDHAALARFVAPRRRHLVVRAEDGGERAPEGRGAQQLEQRRLQLQPVLLALPARRLPELAHPLAERRVEDVREVLRRDKHQS
jgi:hypothetical protein